MAVSVKGQLDAHNKYENDLIDTFRYAAAGLGEAIEALREAGMLLQDEGYDVECLLVQSAETGRRWLDAMTTYQRSSDDAVPLADYGVSLSVVRRFIQHDIEGAGGAKEDADELPF